MNGGEESGGVLQMENKLRLIGFMRHVQMRNLNGLQKVMPQGNRRHTFLPKILKHTLQNFKHRKNAMRPSILSVMGRRAKSNAMHALSPSLALNEACGLSSRSTRVTPIRIPTKMK